MSEDKLTARFMLGEMFERWSSKIWFQVLCCVVVIYLLLAPIAGPIAYKYVNQLTIEKTIDDGNKKAAESHKAAYLKSRETYASVRQIMKSYLAPIDCEYMFLIEYHNGAENVVTGIQFCRFDVSVEVSNESSPYVPIDKFRDDIVARYDVLMGEELADGGCFYTKGEFERIDRYLAYQLSTINAQSYALLNLEDRNGMVFATLLCVSTNEHMNKNQIYRCRDNIRKVMVDFGSTNE